MAGNYYRKIFEHSSYFSCHGSPHLEKIQQFIMPTDTPHSCPNSGIPTLESAPFLRKYSKNIRGRDLNVGDVHGHFSKFKQSLLVVG